MNNYAIKKVYKKISSLKNMKTMNNRKFIEFLYQLVLQREPDENGMKGWLSALRGGMEPMKFFESLIASEEFAITSAKNKNFNLNYPRRKYEHIACDSDHQDKLDLLNYIDLQDDWVKFEDIISKQHVDGTREVNDILKSIYLNDDRQEAFDRFKQSREFYYIQHLLNVLGIETSNRICEVGGGAGYLSWALYTSGYKAIDLFEPNPTRISGVGHLKSLPDAAGLKIFSDLHEWHANKSQYDVIVTKACLHHFGNISQVAASIRQKMRMGGRWIALREQFADNAAELATLLKEHDYCQKFNLYEWGYSAATYVEALEMVGLRLVAIIPAFYANDCIGTNLENADTEDSSVFTAEIDTLIRVSPEVTVDRFWEEHYGRMKSIKISQQYTRPQAMVFEKIPV